jgi:hypothetical protein
MCSAECESSIYGKVPLRAAQTVTGETGALSPVLIL